MKYRGLRSINVQLAILFVSIITLSLILGLHHRQKERGQALLVLEAIRITDRVGAITALVEAVPQSERRDVLQHFSRSNLALA